MRLIDSGGAGRREINQSELFNPPPPHPAARSHLPLTRHHQTGEATASCRPWRESPSNPPPLESQRTGSEVLGVGARGGVALRPLRLLDIISPPSRAACRGGRRGRRGGTAASWKPSRGSDCTLRLYFSIYGEASWLERNFADNFVSGGGKKKEKQNKTKLLAVGMRRHKIKVLNERVKCAQEIRLPVFIARLIWPRSLSRLPGVSQVCHQPTPAFVSLL